MVIVTNSKEYESFEVMNQGQVNTANQLIMLNK